MEAAAAVPGAGAAEVQGWVAGSVRLLGRASCGLAAAGGLCRQQVGGLYWWLVLFSMECCSVQLLSLYKA